MTLSKRAAVLALALLSFLVAPGLAAGPKPDFSAPILACGTSTQTSIDVIVCAGATGAPLFLAELT